MKCSFYGCVNNAARKGFCAGHNWQQKNHGKMWKLRHRGSNFGKKCSGPECERLSKKLGYCQSHYQQVYVYKTGLKRIPVRVECLAAWCKRKCNDNNEHGLCGKCKQRFDKYQMPFQEFISLSGKCDICSSPDGWSIDHNHITGEVRGILCRSHNMGLGMIGDTIDDVKKMLAYLERNVK